MSKPEESWNSRKGFINSEFIFNSVPHPKEISWFLSRSPVMVMSNMNNLTEKIGIDIEKIKKENYVGY